MNEADRLAKALEAGERSGMWYPSMEAAAELRRLSAELAALKAAIEAQGVPDGWKLVPKEPTPEMVGTWKSVDQQEKTSALYKAMLASAPPAPQASVVQQEPVAWANPNDMLDASTSFRWIQIGEFTQPLYTHPAQQAKPQPLSDEQIERCRQAGYSHEGLRAEFSFEKAARAIESAACADRDARIAELERELAELRKDADRYRFIRDANRSSCIDREIAFYAMESLDECVDAAMEDEAKLVGDAAMKGPQ